MSNENNIKIRTGTRVFLECNKGKKFFAHEICAFLNQVVVTKGNCNPRQLSRFVSTAQSVKSNILHPVQREDTPNGYVYWIE